MLLNTGTSLEGVISRGIPCLDQFISSSLITPYPRLIFIQGHNTQSCSKQPSEDYMMEGEILCFLSFFMPYFFEEVTLL